MAERERWGSRLGLILAAAGNAVGIGNLLRFPGQAGANGGGAFMIPYIVSLLLFGLPMVWVAWTIGRYGGRFGHGSTPGMFDRMWKSPAAKYIGVTGVALPLVFCLYYTYIEAWCLGYSWFSISGQFNNTADRFVHMPTFFGEFLGDATTHSYFPSLTTALTFLIIVLVLNVFVLYRGVSRGIEILAKIAMPLLLLFCVVLTVKVISLKPEAGSVVDGLNFLFTPDFSRLKEPGVWIAAAGQIFFTLSIGFGALECYASSLREEEDLTLAALSTASTNEFVEIIFGSMIAIPSAAVFFGADKVAEIAQGNSFALGMVSMPEILRNMAGGDLFGMVWFLLLFFAAFTSSVAVCQPVVAYLQDEARMPRGMAAMLVGLFWFVGTLPVIFFFKYGVLDEMDFWAGTIGLVAFSAVEVILFGWIFGMDRGWKEMHKGAAIRVPRFFYHITKYVTPVLLVFLFGWWFVDAIVKDKLIPMPQIKWGEADRSSYHGDFVRAAPTDNEELKKEFEELQGRITAAVTTGKRDLTAWAEVDLSGGTARVTSFTADPALNHVLSGADFERYLNLQGYRFEPESGNPADADVTVTISLEALHRAPFIWLTRILILGILLTFIVTTRVLWSNRASAT